MSLEELAKIVDRAAKVVKNAEKLSVPNLVVKANKALESYPTDHTIAAVANFLNKRAEAKTLAGLFMTRSELADVYNKLYTPNSKFAEVFKDEMALPEPVETKRMLRSENEGIAVENDYARVADPVLANALSEAFSKDGKLQVYSVSTANQAKKVCLAELSDQGLVDPKRISIFAGNEDLLICEAVYETPKGNSHVLIPVEVSNNKPLFPTIFLSQDGFVELNAEALANHLQKTAGKSFRVDGQKILEVLSVAKNGSAPEPMSAVEYAYLQMKAATETPAEHSADGIVYQKIDSYEPAVKEPVYEQEPEVALFAKNLTSARGQAEFLLGKSAVSAGEKVIARKMAGFGMPHAQIAVAGSSDNAIFYAVSVGSDAGFKVPVSVSNGNVNEPVMAIASGRPVEFSKEGISQLMASSEVDSRMVAAASPLSSLTPSALVDEVRKAMASDNYRQAEEALAVLSVGEDAVAYNTALTVYVGGLSKTASVKQETSCNQIVRFGSSKHPICGHTGLPLHKVYQDSNGDCLPLYRKHTEAPGGASFLANKVFLT